MVSDKRNLVAASVDRGVDDESTSNRDIQHVYERRRNRRINPHTDIIPPSFNILSQPLDILSSVASMVPESQNFSDSNEPVVFRKKTTTLKKRSSAVDDQPLLRKRRRLYKNNRPVGQITDLVPPNFNLLSQATVDSVPNPTKKPSVKRPASMGRCRVVKDLPTVFKTRSSPSGLFNLVQQLNDAQRSAVKAIGFGDLLSLGIYRCPVQFSRHVVNMFDFRRMSLVLNRGEEILMEEEDVQCILNIPRGHLEVEESVGTSLDDPSYHQFLKDWRRRWGIQKDTGAPITTTMPKKILENKDGDNNFKIDFMVYVVSSFLWSNQSTQCRFKILKSLMDVERIKDLNWCRFTLNAVSDGVQKWKNYTGSYFQGPLTLLLLFYVDRIVEYKVSGSYVRNFPIISCWDDETLYKRVKTESKTGGFGLGRVVGRIQHQGDVELNESQYQEPLALCYNETGPQHPRPEQFPETGPQQSPIEQPEMDNSVPSGPEFISRVTVFLNRVAGNVKRIAEVSRDFDKDKEELGQLASSSTGQNYDQLNADSMKDSVFRLGLRSLINAINENDFVKNAFHTMYTNSFDEELQQTVNPNPDVGINDDGEDEDEKEEEEEVEEEDEDEVEVEVEEEEEECVIVATHTPVSVDMEKEANLGGVAIHISDDEEEEEEEEDIAVVATAAPVSEDLERDPKLGGVVADIEDDMDSDDDDFEQVVEEEVATAAAAYQLLISTVPHFSTECAASACGAPPFTVVKEELVEDDIIVDLPLRDLLVQPTMKKTATRKSKTPAKAKGKRKITKLPVALQSPYQQWVSKVSSKLTHLERLTGDFVFNDGLNPSDKLFVSATTNLTRNNLRTMMRGEWLEAGIIDVWVHMLNHKNKKQPRHAKRKIYISNMCSCLYVDVLLFETTLFEELKNFEISFEDIDTADFIFIPVFSDHHYFVACYNMAAQSIDIIDNRKLTKKQHFDDKFEILKDMLPRFLTFLKNNGCSNTARMSRFQYNVMSMPWQNNKNYNDCGIFTMRHLEMYEGQGRGWNIGIPSKGAVGAINELRFKFVSVILYSELNNVRDDIRRAVVRDLVNV